MFKFAKILIFCKPKHLHKDAEPLRQYVPFPKACQRHDISDTNIIIYCNVLIFLFAFIVALYLPANFLEQTSYFAASLDQPLLDHLLLHFRTVDNLVLASF